MSTVSKEPSRTVHDVKQKSQLISKGPPARFRLLTTRSNLEREGSVRKWTFGQRDINMQNKILLMVGETGTGKTTLINAMANHILGVKFTDETWFEITEEGDHMSDQSKTQTTETTVYEVFAQGNPICLTVIDTPGYRDTRGLVMDKQIAENLYKLIHSDSGVKDIDAVCLVVKASENQLTKWHSYIFDAIISLFGKDIQSNIVIFVTHSSGIPPTNAIKAIRKSGIPYRKDEDNKPLYFQFDNCQTVKRRTGHDESLQKAWEISNNSLNDFFASLKEENRKSLKQTESVLTECKQLNTCISNLKYCTQYMKGKQIELNETRKALEENQDKIKKNEDFTFLVKTCYREKVPTENAPMRDRNVTSCSVCEENCHEFKCWLAPSVQLCEVMKDGYCTVCPGRCHFTKHVKEKKKFVTQTKQSTVTFYELKNQCESNNSSASDISLDENVSNTFENVKEDLESNKKQKEEKLRLQRKLNEELDKTEKKKAELLEKAYTAVMKLSEIALKSDSAFIVESLDFLIPLAEETGRDDLAQNLRHLKKIQPNRRKELIL